MSRIADKSNALETVTHVVGDQSDMAPVTGPMMDRFEALLGDPGKTAE